MMNISDKLKEKRKQLGLSVKNVVLELSKREIVISEKTLYGWESGYRQPDADTFVILCDIYKIGNIQDEFQESVLKRTESPTDEKKEAPAISVKAMEVARAYEKADCGTQIAVCKILDLSPTEYRAPHIPDMQKIQKDAEAFAEYANKNLKMPVKK